MNSPYSIAQETLGMSSMQRGLGGMTSPVRPGPNAYDQGGASKPSVNTQPYNNQRLAEQNTLQNITSAAPQAGANAMGQARSQAAAQSDQEAKAQLFAAERMSEALYANQSGTALMQMNAVMQSPEKAKFLNGVATGKAMSAGMSPDLGGEVATKNQYM
tara:strand:- start:3 stop:479 length:477 start_codon:yes stop_codon:yes gene_type:complete